MNAFGSERQDLYISRLRSTGFDVFLSLPRDKSRPFQPFPGPAKGMRGCVAPNAGLSKLLPLMGKGLFSCRKGRPIGQPFQKLLLDHRVPAKISGQLLAIAGKPRRFENPLRLAFH
ncbi:MAG: hypothetical protein C6W56_10145 [Caldibacillus debilis]|nr:MAG: hypothetical protein C6W56_10145 [Caldibacillus debilis]